MKWKIIVAVVIILIIGAIVYRTRLVSNTAKNSSTPSSTTEKTEPTPPITTPTPASTIPWPIIGGKDRVTKIPFGLYVSPTNSPIQPQRFTGYHTGWDFETTEAELNQDVPIVAVCAGPIVYRNSVNGYGGVTIQSCNFNNQPITVLYGHLRLSSIVATGTNLKIGDRIGLLGTARSAETDGERKHLHFDIHKGQGLELRGYVQKPAELSGWLDPTEFFK